MKSGFATKAQAVDAMNGVQADKKAGTYVEPSKQTVGEYLTAWLAAAQGIRPSTITTYGVAIRRHIIPRIGAVPLQQLTRVRVKALYRELSVGARVHGRGELSEKTIHNVHVALRRALADAVEDGLLRNNPADRAHAMPKDRPEMAIWTVEELRRFLDASAGHPMAALWRLAANTGMRRGEVLGLRWKDVDLDGRRLSVRQQLVRAGERVAFGAPKTKAGRRVIALDAGTVAALRERRAAWSADKLHFGKAFKDHDLVFCRPDGHPHDPDVVTHQFDRATVRAGVPRIRLHDLRHTHASLLLQARVHPKVVQERLGHSSITITLDTYSHLIPDMQDEAAAKIGAVVDG